MALEDALVNAGFFATVHSRAHSEKGDVITDHAVIEVAAAFDSVMTLPTGDPGNYDCGRFMGAILSEARRDLPFHVELTTEATSAKRTVQGNKVVTEVTSTIAKGTRDGSGKSRPIGNAGAVIAAAPDKLLERPAGGLGHLTRVEALPVNAMKDRPGTIVHRIRATFTGKAA